MKGLAIILMGCDERGALTNWSKELLPVTASAGLGADVTDVARIVLISLWHGIFTARQGGSTYVAKPERFRAIQRVCH